MESTWCLVCNVIKKQNIVKDVSYIPVLQLIIFSLPLGHAHGVGVHPLIINKCPTFTQIFLLWTECKREQSQS